MGVMGSIGFCDSLSHWVQPPDAEYGVSAKLNRTSGGVGEVADTIRYPDPILTAATKVNPLSLKNVTDCLRIRGYIMYG